MKRFLLFLSLAALFAAGCSKNDPVRDDSGGEPSPVPSVVTAPVTEFDDVSAVLGGSVSGVEVASLTAVGVQYLAAETDAEAPEWGRSQRCTAVTVAAAWNIPVIGLSASTHYLVRAFARTAAGEYYGDPVAFATDAGSLVQPVVETADPTQVTATGALLGGSVDELATFQLNQVGVQFVRRTDPESAQTDWSAAVERTTNPALTWSVPVTELDPGTAYAVRAFVATDSRRYFGEAKYFRTEELASQPLTVAELRARHAAGEPVETSSVRGCVALSVPADCTTESFPAGTIVLYDNTGAPSTALLLTGDGGAEGIGAKGLLRGDWIEVSLAGAKREVFEGTMPGYSGIGGDRVQVLERGLAIDPVWATPSQLDERPDAYLCAPVRISRVYALTPGALFSSVDNLFTDGDATFAVYAAPRSAVGQLRQTGATGTLRGICRYDGRLQVVPTEVADVADFTVPDGIEPGDPAIELLHTAACQFPPQGGTRVVDCRVTAPEGMRLYADMRHVDAARYAVDIVGTRLVVPARANTTGVTAEPVNCYLYLAESKDGQRYVPQTISLMQLHNRYESIPALVQANGGEWASKHEAAVDGVPTNVLKLGSGSSTGHYTSDPTGAEGDRRLTFYAVGWKESKHEAGTLYLRVRGGGRASVEAIALRINDGATGQAPFSLHVEEADRYEVLLEELRPGAVLDFSTSPQFDKRPDDRTGRALLFGVQID